VKPDEFIRQVFLLTGTGVKGESDSDRASLATVLADDSRPLGCSQFNELLLMVNKDRVEGPFFRYFFGAGCTVGQISAGVERFQKTAMLLYGNFAFAYRTLSRLKDEDAFLRALGTAAREPDEELKRFMARKPKLLEIDAIDRDRTPYVGYLSANLITGEYERCELLCRALEKLGGSADWPEYMAEVTALASGEECPVLEETIRNYRAQHPQAGVAEWAGFLEASRASLSALRTRVAHVRHRAAQNQTTYLTWDHMDVYFATSMRKAWEYEDLYDFIQKLMSTPELQDLGIRHFDPTQSYADNRINKGLVEALMLKRARCTVYSVQDTDTLGKDSELASTLAQGKPVIAYVPNLNVDERAAQLASEDPVTVLERLRFVLYADEQLARRLSDQEYCLLDEVDDELRTFDTARIWLSLPDAAAVERLRTKLGDRLPALCSIIARSEKAVYDKRAQTLRESHPLALQVNLETGVANGVLVVRGIPECAALLRRILLHQMEFSLEEEEGMWYLREKVSGSIYRVVTNDPKVTNCFWNFYLID
jgi:hypothetical protein